MNPSRTSSATTCLLFLMLTTGCYKSVKSNEDSADSDSDSSQTDVGSNENSTDSDGDSRETDDMESPIDPELDSPNLRPCMRESSFIHEGEDSSHSKSFFFYNEPSELITEYLVDIPSETWRFSSSIKLVQEAIVPFLGTEYWNTCKRPNKLQLDPIRRSQPGPPWTCCPPFILRFKVGDDGMQTFLEAENSEDGSIPWQERVSADKNDITSTWEVANPYPEQSVTDSRIVFLQDGQERPTEQNFSDDSNVATVGYASEGTMEIIDINFGYHHVHLTYEYKNDLEEIISYTKHQGWETTEIKYTYDDSGNLLQRKETYSSEIPDVWIASDRYETIITKQVVEQNYTYNNRGELTSSTKSYNDSDIDWDYIDTFLQGLVARVSDSVLFTEFRYELDDSGRITKIDMGKSTGNFDAMLEYEYDDDGNMTLAEHSTIGPSGPIVDERMINTYDELGRLSKTEFNQLSSGEQTIHQYSYDCRSYQSTEN